MEEEVSCFLVSLHSNKKKKQVNTILVFFMPTKVLKEGSVLHLAFCNLQVAVCQTDEFDLCQTIIMSLFSML